MLEFDQKHKCCGCQACAQVCPKGAVAMTPDEEGFLYPVVDQTICVECGLCEKTCPLLHTADNQNSTPQAYAACSLNEEIRMESSSGGVFTLLAEHVLGQGGVVYGAAMEGGRVKHIRAANAEDLILLRGSKYVQSDIGTVYLQAKQDLKAGKAVLFTGTPCQIEGLKAFLRKEYARLICMDIICHGVPSPTVWERYVALREKTAGNPAVQMLFRHKHYGWKAFAMFFEFSDHTVYMSRHRDDLFMKAFLHDLCLRPSCYQCGFKKVNRVSDITVADFWGIENVCPEMDDGKGTSLVIVHSKKGRSAFEAVCPNMRRQEVDFSAAIRGNPAMLRSAAKPKQRDAFMQRSRCEDFEKLVAECAKERIAIRGILKKVLKKAGLLEIAKRAKRRILH